MEGEYKQLFQNSYFKQLLQNIDGYTTIGSSLRTV